MSVVSYMHASKRDLATDIEKIEKLEETYYTISYNLNSDSSLEQLNIFVSEEQLFNITEVFTRELHGKSYEELQCEADEKDKEIEQLKDEIERCHERIEYERTEDKQDYVLDIEGRR